VEIYREKLDVAVFAAAVLRLTCAEIIENQFGCTSCKRDSERESERMTLCSSVEAGADEGTDGLRIGCLRVKTHFCMRREERER